MCCDIETLGESFRHKAGILLYDIGKILTPMNCEKLNYNLHIM